MVLILILPEIRVPESWVEPGGSLGNPKVYPGLGTVSLYSLFPRVPAPDYSTNLESCQAWLPRAYPGPPHLPDWGVLALGQAPLCPSFTPTRASRCGDGAWLLLSLQKHPALTGRSLPLPSTPRMSVCQNTSYPSLSSYHDPKLLSSELPAKTQNRAGIQ